MRNRITFQRTTFGENLILLCKRISKYSKCQYVYLRIKAFKKIKQTHKVFIQKIERKTLKNKSLDQEQNYKQMGVSLLALAKSLETHYN